MQAISHAPTVSSTKLWTGRIMSLPALFLILDAVPKFKTSVVAQLFSSVIPKVPYYRSALFYRGHNSLSDPTIGARRDPINWVPRRSSRDSRARRRWSVSDCICDCVRCACLGRSLFTQPSRKRPDPAELRINCVRSTFSLY